MRIVAVCGFGVGSSLLLKISIDKALKQLNLDIEAMNTDITTAKSIDCDVIFTSFDLAEDLAVTRKVPIYPIKRYMDVAEVKTALEDFIQNYQNQRR